MFSVKFPLTLGYFHSIIHGYYRTTKIDPSQREVNIGISSTLRAMISGLWPWFVMKLSQEKDSLEEIESFTSARVERNSPEWVCIPQKSLAIARDFWNTNSLGWIPFRMGVHDGFSMYWVPVRIYKSIFIVTVSNRVEKGIERSRRYFCGKIQNMHLIDIICTRS